MFVQELIENQAASIISSSLAFNGIPIAGNGVTGWQISTGISNTIITFPSIRVVAGNYEPKYPEANAGYGDCALEIWSMAIKPNNQGIGITAQTFESVSDMVFSPFLANNIVSTMTYNNLQVLLVKEHGLEVASMDDGWIATQKLLITCQRSS